jgi:hypothetical protein
MSAGRLTEDGNTPEITIKGANTHIAVKGTFGGGTVTVQEQVNGTWYAAEESSGTDITLTASDDLYLGFNPSDKIRLNLAGATNPAIDWQITDKANG